MRYVLFLFLLSFCMTSCQSNPDKKLIKVVGQASKKVVPDMVELSLRAYSVRPSMKDAVAETQAAVAQIQNVCKRYAVNIEDIKVSSISTNKAYEYHNNSERFVGYDAMQVLDVTLKDISKIERFTEELLATKISKIDNIRYNHTKADSIMREVNLLALEDAHKTAEKMCNKMNTSLGTVVYLSNFDEASGNEQHNIRNSEPEYNMNLYSKSFGGNGFKMTAEILEFSDVAYASFELK